MILHIANWYPNSYNPLECQFIKEHFDALQLYGKNELWHIQVRNEGGLFTIKTGKYSENENFIILNTTIQSWFVIERLHFLLLLILKWKLSSTKITAVNFHIAYPLLRFPKAIKWLFGKNIIITEHWSAYRLGFNLPKGNKARTRIENIFHQKLPVITVSNALMGDIINFSGTDKFNQYIVPNVVDTRLFNLSNKEELEKINFLMVANWAPIKRPFLVLEAFKEIVKTKNHIKLNIIGYGEQWENMVDFVKKNNMEPYVDFLGKKSKIEIADQLKQTTVFLHPSEYETFSVVCAEALCCGIPVIASNVGGIKEVVFKNAGILVDNSIEAWKIAIQTACTPEFLSNIDKYEIAKIAGNKYSKDAIGKHYSNVLSKILIP